MSTLPGLFDHLAGAPTVQRLFSAPGGVIHGTFKPGRPFPPIWTPDGDCRMGFTQFGNGYVYGPEGTSLAQFQAAIDAGQIPGIHPGTVATPQDYYDAMYLMGPTPGTSLYAAYVKPVPPVIDVPPAGGGSGSGSGSSGSVGAGSGTSDPCAAVKADLTAAQKEAAGLRADLRNAMDQVTRARAAAAKARKQMPTRGGGQFKTVLVSLLDTLDQL